MPFVAIQRFPQDFPLGNESSGSFDMKLDEKVVSLFEQFIVNGICSCSFDGTTNPALALVEPWRRSRLAFVVLKKRLKSIV